MDVWILFAGSQSVSVKVKFTEDEWNGGGSGDEEKKKPEPTRTATHRALYALAANQLIYLYISMIKIIAATFHTSRAVAYATDANRHTDRMCNRVATIATITRSSATCRVSFL